MLWILTGGTTAGSLGSWPKRSSHAAARAGSLKLSLVTCPFTCPVACPVVPIRLPSPHLPSHLPSDLPSHLPSDLPSDLPSHLPTCALPASSQAKKTHFHQITAGAGIACASRWNEVTGNLLARVESTRAV